MWFGRGMHGTVGIGNHWIVTDHSRAAREQGTQNFNVVEKVLDLHVGCEQWLEKGGIKSFSFSIVLLVPLHCGMA
jgi:hypothetical protein